MQAFHTQFTLSRAYLAECFDQSLPHGKNARANYLFPASLGLAGLGLLIFVAQAKLVGSMFIALSLLELLHIRYRRAWWLTRQMWGKSGGSEVKLIINDDGIQTQTSDIQTTLRWADIEQVIETDLGLILVTQSGAQQYLSKSLFPAELVGKIVSKSA